MKKLTFAVAAFAAALTPAIASAQDAPASTETAADGTDAFGIEPYFGISGGYESYDSNLHPNLGIPNVEPRYEGSFVEGTLGVNIPLNRFFVGVEGNVAKGINGDIDWRYGVAGRAGVRMGDSGMIYGRGGYEWTNFANPTAGNRDYGNEVYGIGVEVGPKDIGLGGITGNSGARIRLEMNTTDFNSIRPTAGVVFHF